MEEQSDTPSWWRCDTHGPGTRTAWGCPECVRELRTSLATATRERDEARAIANDRDAMVDHRDRALTAMYQRVDVITQERDEAIADLETERLRLAACGVVAMANTPESAARVRDILPVHFSASLHSVMGAVDREMELRAEVERLRSALVDVVNQIRKCGPVDELGHLMTMNRAYLEAETLLDSTVTEVK